MEHRKFPEPAGIRNPDGPTRSLDTILAKLLQLQIFIAVNVKFSGDPATLLNFFYPSSCPNKDVVSMCLSTQRHVRDWR